MTTPDTARDNPVTGLNADVFPLAAVLTVLVGSNDRPFCTLGNLYRILGFMLQNRSVDPADPDAHGIPRAELIDDAIAVCKPEILRQHPELAAITKTRATSDTGILTWIADQETRYGLTVTLTPLPKA
ncbi:hypothetical protein [Mycolicibacterium komossense]|uniref:Uncharacterized protein n=1 Tax=Mycolicibacterium komossense TaxID=1779 RepID=A0ABT3CML6_9MYCO|nr:hypothetical protein [Mycolicibacterium komossense]MCV7230705.1 hypothetical protein [Mycolicibacterium komossense]